MELPINTIVILVVLLVLLAIMLVLISRRVNNFANLNNGKLGRHI